MNTIEDKLKAVFDRLINGRGEVPDGQLAGWVKEGKDALAAAKEEQGKLLTMQDVLLACGELNKRERVAVQWVLDRCRPAKEEQGKVEPVAWLWRWTNPQGDDVHPSSTEWSMLTRHDCAPGQTLENKIAELRGYVSDNGRVQYEVRPVYFAPAKGSDVYRDEVELLESLVRAERATPTEANRRCTDEQFERVHPLAAKERAKGSGLTVEGVMQLVDEHLKPMRTEILGEDVISGKTRFRKALEDLAGKKPA